MGVDFIKDYKRSAKGTIVLFLDIIHHHPCPYKLELKTLDFLKCQSASLLIVKREQNHVHDGGYNTSGHHRW